MISRKILVTGKFLDFITDFVKLKKYEFVSSSNFQWPHFVQLQIASFTKMSGLHVLPYEQSVSK